MKKTIRFIIILYLNISFADKGLTSFIWVSNPDRSFHGTCYEVDSDTKGTRYQVRARRESCKTKNTIFHWVPKIKGFGGKCYELDRSSKGEKYANTANEEKCRPKNVSYQWIQNSSKSGICVLVDDQTGGETYSKKANDKKCLARGVSYFWLLKPRGTSSICWAIDDETGGQLIKKKVSKVNCLPDKTSFVLIADRNKSKCYEVDKESGAQGFIRNVSSSKCNITDSSTSEHVFSWVPNAKDGGRCFRLITNIDGVTKPKLVKYHNCLPDKYENVFFRTNQMKGKCFVVDSLSQGGNFKKLINIKGCRLKKLNLTTHWFAQSQNVKEGCYIYDVASSGAHYVEKLLDSKCRESIGEITWVANDGGWGGECIGLMKVGKKIKKKKYSHVKCRPKDILIVWHNFSEMSGGCYDVDKKKGQYSYSMKIKTKKCRPKKTKVRFFRAKDKNSGSCYQVDSETNGKKYNQKVSRRKCKELLYKPLSKSQDKQIILD